MSGYTVNQLACPECMATDIVDDVEVGESVCGSCGLVVQENALNREPEWRIFTPQETKTKARAGAPTKYTHFDKGLSTIIQIDRDAFGHYLSSKVRRQMWRLRKRDTRSKYRSSQQRNLGKAMDELQRLSDKLHTPSSIQEMAAVIYRKVLNEDLVRGRSIKSIVAAALYAACRFTKIPRTLKEIAEASPRSKKEISRAYITILRNIPMKMPVDDSLDYVTKIAEKAGVSGDVEGLAFKIIREAKSKHAATGKDPSGLAAAALYIASKLRKKRIKQLRLAKAADVTTVTLRNRSKELMNRINLNSI